MALHCSGLESSKTSPHFKTTKCRAEPYKPTPQLCKLRVNFNFKTTLHFYKINIPLRFPTNQHIMYISIFCLPFPETTTRFESFRSCLLCDADVDTLLFLAPASSPW